MKLYWIRDRIKQGHFTVRWLPGIGNHADYFTKHHPHAHHRRARSNYFLDPNAPQQSIRNVNTFPYRVWPILRIVDFDTHPKLLCHILRTVDFSTLPNKLLAVSQDNNYDHYVWRNLRIAEILQSITYGFRTPLHTPFRTPLHTPFRTPLHTDFASILTHLYTTTRMCWFSPTGQTLLALLTYVYGS